MSHNNQFLDDSNIADPDQILLSIFKSTATTVTQLYKESLNQSTKSYKNGYKQCLLDLMHFASLQQHQRNSNNQGNRVALTFDELMTFYNSKQNQLNSLDDNSNQNLSHSSSMSNVDEANTTPTTNDTIINNNNNNNNNSNNNNNNNRNRNNDTNYQENNNIESTIATSPIDAENKFPENEIIEKPNLMDLKTNFNFSKGFTFRFNNDQFSPNFNNVNIINPQENMKRRFGNMPNTINFLGRTFNFDNFDNVSEPPLKRNRWRRDDRMTE